MEIKSAEFIKGIVGDDNHLYNNIPQVAFIGRSNVGKSSVINSLTNKKNLARSSSRPGCTQEINLFLINKSLYLVDLPGYGYAKLPMALKAKIEELINWYFFVSSSQQKKVVLIIDAKVGLTKDDIEILRALEDVNKDIIIVANKVDKLKKAELTSQLKKITEIAHTHKVIAYSAEKKIGVGELLKEILENKF